MSTDDILHLTNRLRRKLNLYDRTYFPIVEFIETVLPEIDPKFSYLYVAKNEMPDTYAYFITWQTVLSSVKMFMIER